MPDPFASGLPALRGDRVALRAITEADDPDLLAVFGRGDHLRYWSHAPLADLDAAREYREGIEAGTADRSFFQWAITEAGDTDGRLVGTTTLGSWDRDNRHAEIGFIVRPDVQGRGIATDAVRTVLRFGFAEMGLHRVEADVDPENAGSMRLLKRLGFQREGLFRERWFTWFGERKDSAMFGLLARDFVDAPPRG
ncbi:MAG: GNAT family protein [Bacteroidota bacterium]